MKQILTVGYEVPGYSDRYVSFRSASSLLDADIVLFLPDISQYRDDGFNSPYQGKRSLNENSSFQLIEDVKHWKKELNSLLTEGKTVFVLFSSYEEVYIYTGKKETSGTGRNQKTTNFVDQIHNYTFLPVPIPQVIPKSGKELKFCGNPIFASFWNEFKNHLSYESYLDGKIQEALFVTKNGNKPLGGLFKIGNGNLILLPTLDYDIKDFITEKNDKKQWNKKGIEFGSKLVKSLIEIDKSLSMKSDLTPPPDWMNIEKFKIESEIIIEEKIKKVESDIENLIKEKSQLNKQLFDEQLFKALLYEKGKALEISIINALQILDYKAENYDDGIDEFDQIIISPEGHRFIGEAEGKDSSAVNIDKFRQLESNIQQDFSKEEIINPAIGILFGNGYRLTPPEARQTQFTEKCLINAKRLNVILIQTMDLFEVVKYLKSKNDDSFKIKCREAIINSKGDIVVFPKPN